MKFQTFSAKELDSYRGNPYAVVIDVRTADEYEKMHFDGAINIPYEELIQKTNLPRDKNLILYCERGSMSLMAAKILSQKGYRVKTMVGGIHTYRGSNLISTKGKD